MEKISTVKNLNETYLEVKTERMIDSLIRGYIKDNYHLISYEKSEMTRHIDVWLECRSNKNTLRICTYYDNKILIYKNRKLNKEVKVLN